MEQSQMKLAMFVVWIILSGIILCILITPLLFTADKIRKVTPECQWKKYNKECPLCGMTTSFIYISQGEFSQAVKSNSFSPYLYFVFVLNEILMIFVLFQKKVKRDLLG